MTSAMDRVSKVVTLRAEVGLIDHRLIHKLRLHNIGKFLDGRVPDIEATLRRSAEALNGDPAVFLFSDLQAPLATLIT